MKIKSEVNGEIKNVTPTHIMSHDLLQEGGKEFATKFYVVEDEDGEESFETDEKNETVLVFEYYQNGELQHGLILNDQYTKEYRNCDIWYEVK